MTMKRWIPALLMLAFAAVPVSGQHKMDAPGQHGGMMDQSMMCHAMMGDAGEMMGQSMMEGGMMEMMKGRVPAPAAILGAAERLELTPDQTARLEALAKSSKESRMGHMQAAMAAHRTAAEALSSENPDLVAYELGLQDAARHMVGAHLAMARVGLDANAILTPTQRDEAKDLALASSMMCGMGEGGMMGAKPGEEGARHEHIR